MFYRQEVCNMRSVLFDCVYDHGNWITRRRIKSSFIEMKSTVTEVWIDIGRSENIKISRIIRDHNLYPKMWILDAVALDQRIIRLPRHDRSPNHIDWLIHSFIQSINRLEAFVWLHLTRLSGALQQYRDTKLSGYNMTQQFQFTFCSSHLAYLFSGHQLRPWNSQQLSDALCLKGLNALLF